MKDSVPMIYTVADTEASIRQNRGTEIVASSFEEARNKAEALGVPCCCDQPGGDSTYAISDGREIVTMECEDVVPAGIYVGSDEEAFLSATAPMWEGGRP